MFLYNHFVVTLKYAEIFSIGFLLLYCFKNVSDFQILCESLWTKLRILHINLKAAMKWDYRLLWENVYTRAKVIVYQCSGKEQNNTYITLEISTFANALIMGTILS